MFILQSIILIITIMSIVLFIIEVFKLNKSSRLDVAYASRYKWRIVEITHNDKSKNYSLQVKKFLIWDNYVKNFDSLGTCQTFYIGLLNYEKQEQKKKIDKKIINKKIINLK